MPTTTVVRSTHAGAAAVQLRVSGASFADIAATLGMSDAAAALRAVERELAAQGHMNADARDRLRAETSARLEWCMSLAAERAENRQDPEQLAAIKTMVSIIDRYSRLHGLDQPTEVVVHTPTATELEQWVATMVRTTMPQLEEADVIDLGDEDIEETVSVGPVD